MKIILFRNRNSKSGSDEVSEGLAQVQDVKREVELLRYAINVSFEKSSGIEFWFRACAKKLLSFAKESNDAVAICL